MEESKGSKAFHRKIYIYHLFPQDHRRGVRWQSIGRGFENSLEPVRLDLGEDCAGHTRSFEVIQYHPTWSIATGRSRAKIAGSHPCRENTGTVCLCPSLSLFFFSIFDSQIPGRSISRRFSNAFHPSTRLFRLNFFAW